MIAYILALMLGMLAGMVTGLIPGIHINLIAALVITLPLFTIVPAPILIVGIVALAITHTFLDFIPSIFLGAASEETITAVLPGHAYLLHGQGYHALTLTTRGSLIAIGCMVLVIPIITFIVKTSYPLIETMMGFILITVIVLLFYQDTQSKMMALGIFFLSGVLGCFVLNSSVREPLLPLLTGLFGTSTLINAICLKTHIPKQTIKRLPIRAKDMVRPTLTTMCISPVCSFLPGLGASQAATLATRRKEGTQDEYLILVGSINTLIIATSFVTLYLIGKSRSGAAHAINKLLPLTQDTMISILITIVVTALLAYPLTLLLGKHIARHIDRVPYVPFSIIVLSTLIIITGVISGMIGILVLITATALGLLTITYNVTRSHLMGVILIPTTLYYLPFF